jgi:lipopolysaccharide transport system ATP-binding protein
MKPAIRAENLSKRYRLGAARADNNLTETVRAHLGRAWGRVTGRARPAGADEFWALKDVSFEVAPGDIVGVVGRNGAGKSTLLKVLSRIVEPTGGRAEIRGRIGSLLEVGTGFHPELTGRENVYLNGSVLGMTRREIARKFDEIVAFSEVERFLDTPVKRYSSGMYVRLAFAVAAHLEPEILVVDEVLAVGDTGFQRKCLDRLREVARGGGTALVVSHDSAAVRRLCRRVVWLDAGAVRAAGPTGPVMDQYLAVAGDVLRPSVPLDLTAAVRRGSGEAAFTRLAFHGGVPGRGVVSGGPLHLSLRVRSDAPRVADTLAVILFDTNGVKLVNADTVITGEAVRLAAGETAVGMTIRAVHLNPGRYRLGLNLSRRPATEYDHIDAAGEIEVLEPDGSTRVRPPQDGVVACDFHLTPGDDA